MDYRNGAVLTLARRKIRLPRLQVPAATVAALTLLLTVGDLASSKKAKNALLVGSEGGLEVFRVLPNKFEVVGRLEGLRGSVIGAKILPHVDVFDPTESRRPLVAVIVHGPDTRPVPGSGDEANEPTHYQTIVEVYSLQSQEYLTTLYCSTLAAIEQPGFGQISSLPAPIGDLILTANGKYVVVASGKSGEIFVFSNAQTSVNTGPSFRFIGKYWTTVQSSLDSQSRPSSSSDASQTAEELDEKPGIPIVALSQRWLAVVSPSNSAHISIQGAPLLVPHSPNPPGLASHVAPPQPPITCDIAGVDEEGAWSRIRRQATQSVVKYSQKGIEMGWQGWKELTNPTSQPGSYHGRTSSKDAQFPPTNAPPEDPRRITKEPAVVSIIDLETLLDAEEQKPKYPPAPIATFALDEGCNFLSFSSNGLRLLTVSQKGEVSTIWDLSQVNHGTAAYGSNKEDEITHGPCVKQIHRITRSSQSVVVEAAWSRDDDCLALLTTHGTVHLHEVPTQTCLTQTKAKIYDLCTGAGKGRGNCQPFARDVTTQQQWLSWQHQIWIAAMEHTGQYDPLAESGGIAWYTVICRLQRNSSECRPCRWQSLGKRI